MRFLSKPFRRKPDDLPPWAALDQESLRIGAAMEHVQDHGNLDSFPASQNERLALMLTASRQGLVMWDRAGERYELTSLGRQRLGMRRALQESGGPMNLPPSSAGSPMNLPPASAVPAGRFLALGSGTIMAGIAGLAIGAAAMTLLPGASKLPQRDRAAVATVARNPGIPCLAERCLETGGNAERPAQQAGNPEQSRNAPVPAPAAAPAGPPPEPSQAQTQQQAAVHPGQAGVVDGVLAPQPPRRSAERARTYQAPAIDPEPPGYAQSTAGETTARAAEKPGRNRHAATEQRQSWSDGRRKPSTNRGEYVEEQAGGPEQGAIVRRYPGQDDASLATRRYRGEQAGRRGGDAEDRPGYAYREPQGFGYREGRRRFGPFDWLFR
jgi:hypothetical protein